MVSFGIIAKGMESVYIDLVSVGTDKGLKAAAHRDSSCVGVGETKDVFGRSISFQQYLSYPAGKYLSFAGARPGNYHHGTLNRIDRLALFFIEPVVFLCKFLF